MALLPKAKHFPGFGVVSHVCDHCSRPLSFLVYRGRDGEYCSKQCYDATERPFKKEKGRKMSKKNKASEEVITGNVRESNPPVVTKKSKKDKGKAEKKAKTAAKPEKKVSDIPAAGVEGAKVFRAGSAQAAVFTLLADGKSHKEADVIKVAEKAGSQHPAQSLRYVIGDGEKTKAWTVTKDKEAGTVKMVLKKKPV